MKKISTLERAPGNILFLDFIHSDDSQFAENDMNRPASDILSISLGAALFSSAAFLAHLAGRHPLLLKWNILLLAALGGIVGLILGRRFHRLGCIRQAHIELSRVFDAASPLCLLDEKMMVRRVNHSFCRCFHIHPQDISGRPAGEIFARLSSEPRLNDMRTLLPRTLDPNITRHEFTFVLQDGSRRRYLVMAAAFQGLDTDDDGLLLNFMDVTRLKAAEAENAAPGRRLPQARKLEALGALAGGVAHDFNNILFPIIGYAEILKKNQSITGKARDHLNQIFRAAHRARGLIRQIRMFSRRTAVKLTPLDPVPVIREALKLLRSTIPATIEMTTDFPPDTGLVLIDPTELHQIIMNLCTNAFHSMEADGGTLRVTLAPGQLPADGLTGAPAPIPGIELTVSDTGTGIAKEMLGRVFDPYFTSKTGEKGTGLGLSVVHGIVTGYGGSVDIDSTPGAGTSVRICLPVCDEAEGRAVREDIDQARPCEGMESILMVDDETPILTLTEQELTQLGFRVTSCDSSRKALSLFQRNPAAFDLVVADLTMPEMTGDRLAREMTAIRPDLPVIMMTGRSGDTMSPCPPEIRLLLHKPVMINDLARHIRAVLDAAPGAPSPPFCPPGP